MEITQQNTAIVEISTLEKQTQEIKKEITRRNKAKTSHKAHSPAMLVFCVIISIIGLCFVMTGIGDYSIASAEKSETVEINLADYQIATDTPTTQPYTGQPLQVVANVIHDNLNLTSEQCKLVWFTSPIDITVGSASYLPDCVSLMQTPPVNAGTYYLTAIPTGNQPENQHIVGYTTPIAFTIEPLTPKIIISEETIAGLGNMIHGTTVPLTARVEPAFIQDQMGGQIVWSVTNNDNNLVIDNNVVPALAIANTPTPEDVKLSVMATLQPQNTDTGVSNWNQVTEEVPNLVVAKGATQLSAMPNNITICKDANGQYEHIKCEITFTGDTFTQIDVTIPDADKNIISVEPEHLTGGGIISVTGKMTGQGTIIVNANTTDDFHAPAQLSIPVTVMDLPRTQLETTAAGFNFTIPSDGDINDVPSQTAPISVIPLEIKSIPTAITTNPDVADVMLAGTETPNQYLLTVIPKNLGECYITIECLGSDKFAPASPLNIPVKVAQGVVITP